jgi:hypothetical protein
MKLGAAIAPEHPSHESAACLMLISESNSSPLSQRTEVCSRVQGDLPQKTKERQPCDNCACGHGYNCAQTNAGRGRPVEGKRKRQSHGWLLNYRDKYDLYVQAKSCKNSHSHFVGIAQRSTGSKPSRSSPRAIRHIRQNREHECRPRLPYRYTAE